MKKYKVVAEGGVDVPALEGKEAYHAAMGDVVELAEPMEGVEEVGEA